MNHLSYPCYKMCNWGSKSYILSQSLSQSKMLCAIWYHLYNLKNVKSTYEKVLFKVAACNLLKVTLLQGCFSGFLNCTNSTNSRKSSHMFYIHTLFVYFECQKWCTINGNRWEFQILQKQLLIQKRDSSLKFCLLYYLGVNIAHSKFPRSIKNREKCKEYCQQ